ncbi:MAG: YybH family protein [Gemmatimonadales bacterium]
MRATGMAAAAIVLLGCQQAAETPEQRDARITTESAAARTAIEARNAEFMTHFNQGHGEQVAALYAEDGAVMAPNAPAVEGHAAIQRMVTDFAAMKAQVTLITQSVVANGPMALERGTFRMTFMPPGATTAAADTGKYLVHWRNVDGKWLLVEDMFNSDLPMTAPPPAKK